MSELPSAGPVLTLGNGVQMPALGLGVGSVDGNLDVLDLALDKGEITAIDALDTGARAGREPDSVGRAG